MTQSAQLTKMSIKEFVSPRRIIGVLRAARVPLVLVGQYGFDGWLQETRQCECVEIVIRPRSERTTLRELTAAFTALRWQGAGSVFQFKHKKTGKALISIQLAEEPLVLSIFEHFLRLDVSPSLNYGIPRLEMALALSFASMTRRPWSDADKYYDAAQFIRIVKVNPQLDIEPSGGRRLVKKVRDLHAGKRFEM